MSVMLNEALQRNAKHEARLFKHLWLLNLKLFGRDDLRFFAPLGITVLCLMATPTH